MPFSNAQLDDINLLCRFNLDSTQAGLKIHSAAGPQVQAAARRLFEKGLITQGDGGYLTDLGHKAAEHAQQLLQILK